MGTGRKQAFWTKTELKEMATDDVRRRTMVGPADEAMSYTEQAERVRKISSAALVKLHMMLASATTPGEISAIVSVLLDASKLAKEATALPGKDPSKLSDDELDAAIGKATK